MTAEEWIEWEVRLTGMDFYMLLLAVGEGSECLTASDIAGAVMVSRLLGEEEEHPQTYTDLVTSFRISMTYLSYYDERNNLLETERMLASQEEWIKLLPLLHNLAALKVDVAKELRTIGVEAWREEPLRDLIRKVRGF